MISSISVRISNTSEHSRRPANANIATAFDQPADILLGFVIDPTPFNIVRPALLDSIIDVPTSLTQHRRTRAGPGPFLLTLETDFRVVTQVPNPFGPKPHPPSSKLPPDLNPEQAQLDPYSSLAENTDLTLQEKITVGDQHELRVRLEIVPNVDDPLVFFCLGSDTFLQMPPNSEVSLIQYHVVGGILDFYFFPGPSDAEVITQYGSVIGYPMWQPAWGFGFHLCRWGYHNVSDDIENVAQMHAAGIPLEVQWNDIDLYHTYRDFTTDPVSFSGDELRAFIRELAANNQHYIPIVDVGIAITLNSTDVYDPFTRGIEEDVWIKNPDGSLYLGQV
ncbi:glycosyl hydrolases family 31-domain-containing protein [Suillus discolor]|uniref:Glycosyl hydrolases family 31-domain-containing protein n=1 Tax=Suillus discolor TaxID=1912936 RepID=A0A9P7F9T2_9AGAM|nr:glycosyl hydrolases family 31-domain-containing protein [Suillus discolor]KAG2110217.1 glycosyl hydrolases family 31-domain-containing protein [Suillus discolor]